MKVKELMSTPVVTVPPYTPIRDVARQMDYCGVGCVAVLANEGLVGVATDRDLALRALAKGEAGDTPVSEVMTTDPVTVRPDDDIDTAFDAFRRHSFRRLPVVDRGTVLGMLTVDDLLLQVHRVTTDLLRPVAREISEPQHHIEEDD